MLAGKKKKKKKADVPSHPFTVMWYVSYPEKHLALRGHTSCLEAWRFTSLRC